MRLSGVRSGPGALYGHVPPELGESDRYRTGMPQNIAELITAHQEYSAGRRRAPHGAGAGFVRIEELSVLSPIRRRFPGALGNAAIPEHLGPGSIHGAGTLWPIKSRPVPASAATPVPCATAGMPPKSQTGPRPVPCPPTTAAPGERALRGRPESRWPAPPPRQWSGGRHDTPRTPSRTARSRARATRPTLDG